MFEIKIEAIIFGYLTNYCSKIQLENHLRKTEENKCLVPSSLGTIFSKLLCESFDSVVGKLLNLVYKQSLPHEYLAKNFSESILSDRLFVVSENIAAFFFMNVGSKLWIWYVKDKGLLRGRNEK